MQMSSIVQAPGPRCEIIDSTANFHVFLRVDKNDVNRNDPDAVTIEKEIEKMHSKLASSSLPPSTQILPEGLSKDTQVLILSFSTSLLLGFHHLLSYIEGY